MPIHNIKMMLVFNVQGDADCMLGKLQNAPSIFGDSVETGANIYIDSSNTIVINLESHKLDATHNGKQDEYSDILPKYIFDRLVKVLKCTSLYLTSANSDHCLASLCLEIVVVYSGAFPIIDWPIGLYKTCDELDVDLISSWHELSDDGCM